MATFIKFDSWVEFMCEGANVGSDAFKIYLTNATPSASADSVIADLAEISAGNGYTAGGVACTTSSAAQTSGTYKLTLADPAVITASGGTIGPFRYAVLYDDTLASDPLVGAWDINGTNITLNSGDTLTIDLSAANGVFTVGP